MEIEKKFLVEVIPRQLEQYTKKEISQAYISTDPTIRIRKSNSSFILTIKGKGSISREEYELNISENQYNNLAVKAETPFITKTRYIIPIGNTLKAELDEYHSQLEGLYTVEVEFSTISEAEAFIPPIWFGKDVSNDKRYKNTSLSLNGIPK